jgi:hypothetical protein
LGERRDADADSEKQDPRDRAKREHGGAYRYLDQF